MTEIQSFGSVARCLEFPGTRFKQVIDTNVNVEEKLLEDCPKLVEWRSLLGAVEAFCRRGHVVIIQRPKDGSLVDVKYLIPFLGSFGVFKVDWPVSENENRFFSTGLSLLFPA